MRKLPIKKKAPGWSVSEFFYLFWLNLSVQAKSVVDFFRTVFRYYSNIQFMKVDLSLLLMYFFRSPYAISKQFLVEKGEEEVYAYGETPLPTMELIARECGITKEDTFFEIGSGRGRVCFWMHSFIGCGVVGIEFIPKFVSYANRIKEKLHIENVDFRLEDMLEADYSKATVCYLYGSCLPDETIEKLIKKLSKLATGTKIITVSYPLTDYHGGDHFEVMKRFNASFTWGDADVFLQVIK